MRHSKSCESLGSILDYDKIITDKLDAHTISSEYLKTRKSKTSVAKVKKLKTKAHFSDKSVINRGKACSLKINNKLTVPVIDTNKVHPCPGEIAVDENTKQLFYSEGEYWNLAGTWQAKRDISVNANGAGDFKTVQEAVNSVRSTVLEGKVNINIEPGLYDEGDIFSIIDVNFSAPSSTFSSDANKFNIIGDTREIASMSFSDGLQNFDFSGSNAGPIKIKLESTVVTIETEGLDLTKRNLVKGDKIKIITASNLDFGKLQTNAIGIIDNVTTNTIVLQNSLPDDILEFSEKLGTTITFLPNVEITAKNFEIYSSSVSISGILFTSPPDPIVITASRSSNLAMINVTIIGLDVACSDGVSIFVNNCSILNAGIVLGTIADRNNCYLLATGNTIVTNVAGMDFYKNCNANIEYLNLVGSCNLNVDVDIHIFQNVYIVSVGTFPNGDAQSALNLSNNCHVRIWGGGLKILSELQNGHNYTVINVENSSTLNIPIDINIEIDKPPKDSNYFNSTINSTIFISKDIFTGITEINAPRTVYNASDNSYINASTPHQDLPAATVAAYHSNNFSNIRGPDNVVDRFPGPVITEVGSQVLP